MKRKEKIKLTRNMAKRKRQKGFSMIEVLIVVVMVGVMAMIAIPSIRVWLPKYELRTARREVASAMLLGRVRAISTGCTFYVDFDCGGDGLEKVFLLANVALSRNNEQSIEIDVDNNEVVVIADKRYSFSSKKQLVKHIAIFANREISVAG